MAVKRITVFGGSAPKAGEAAYEDALLLGKLLGEAGHTLMTGGYIGTMEAVSRGANEAGGHVIGVGWQAIFEQMFSHLEDYVPETHRQLLVFAPDVTAASLELQNLLEHKAPNS